MSPEEWCRLLFGDRSGYVALAFGTGPHRTGSGPSRYEHSDWEERAYVWPDDLDRLCRDAEAAQGGGEDVYVCPALRSTPERRKGTALPPLVCWVDLDREAADQALYEELSPVIVESGTPGHRHLHIVLSVAVDLQRWTRLQTALRDRLGGDHKVADNDLLRFPGTRNHKTDPPTRVLALPWSGHRWEPAELAGLLGVDLDAAVPRGTGTSVEPTSPEAPPVPLPGRVLWALRHPQTNKSDDHHRVVAACYDSELTLGQTIGVIQDYEPSIEKYGARLSQQVVHSWENIMADRNARQQRAVATFDFVSGGSFILDEPEVPPALWGDGDELLWIEGEPLILTGPTGVGKTTVGSQVVAGRMGLISEVLGMPVAEGQRTLILAMDRPRQIARALGRHFRSYNREILDTRLTVWRGPPPEDLARNPEVLHQMAAQAGADTVVIDSLKDAAAGLSNEEVGQGINRAMQICVTNGVQVLAYHHQTKQGGNGKGSKPNSLNDVYGSAWITAGAGSVVLLWGEAGATHIELIHLKQPASPVGPLKIRHDHAQGLSAVQTAESITETLRFNPDSMTVKQIAVAVIGREPTNAELQKVRRDVDKLLSEGRVEQVDGASSGGASGGGKAAAYRLLSNPSTDNGADNATRSSPSDNMATNGQRSAESAQVERLTQSATRSTA